MKYLVLLWILFFSFFLEDSLFAKKMELKNKGTIPFQKAIAPNQQTSLTQSPERFQLGTPKGEFFPNPKQKHLPPHVLALLRQARDLHSAGQNSEAQNLLRKVRILSPQTPMPPWATQPSPTRPPYCPLTRNEILGEAKKNSTPETLQQLEKVLMKNPNDIEARILLLEHADSTQNLNDIRRHRSSLGMSLKDQIPTWKWVFSLLVFAGIIWQIRELHRDLRNPQKIRKR